MRARTDKAARTEVPPTRSAAPAPGTGSLRTPLGRWLLRGKDGRLTAYALGREGVLRWTENRPGGPEWTGPELLPAPDLTDLVVAQGRDGYAHLVGRRSVAKKGAPPDVSLVHAVQYQTGRPLSPFRPLGNPHADAARAAKIGVPSVAVDAGGTVHVLVRNAGRGLSMRREDKAGKWEAWSDLKGSLYHDSPAAVATGGGAVEVLVAGEGPSGHWHRAKPAGAFERRADIPLSVAPASLTALETGEGSITYYWTDPANGGIVAHRPGGWLVPIGGAPGKGPVSVLRAPLGGEDRTVFAYRDVAGRILLASCACENEQSGVWWSPTAERSTGVPGLAADAHGRIVLATLGEEGRLRIARQNAEPGLVLGPSIAA